MLLRMSQFISPYDPVMKPRLPHFGSCPDTQMHVILINHWLTVWHRYWYFLCLGWRVDKITLTVVRILFPCKLACVFSSKVGVELLESKILSIASGNTLKISSCNGNTFELRVRKPDFPHSNSTTGCEKLSRSLHTSASLPSPLQGEI